jgi:predicted amidophosphoribosyltransferase
MPGLPLGEYAGFPNCPNCPYLAGGPMAVCRQCASETLEPLSEDHCPICSQALDPITGRCRNVGLCRDTGRSIQRIDAIAVYSGALASAIQRLKYGSRIGWARIFGRLVMGHLEATTWPGEFDLILPNPTWCGLSGSAVPHTECSASTCSDRHRFTRAGGSRDLALRASS